ncbi:MAG: hypothetical protein GC206_15305 [Alphaproteobacteria bacterium]|nr:hypothetical protein [Alphaproteobacteria bacterium]
MRMHDSLRQYAAPLLVGCAIATAPTLAVGLDNEPTPGVTPTPTENETNPNTPDAAEADRTAAQELVDEAVTVVNAMQSDPEVAALMRRAEGIYIVPDFGRAALGIGGEGGAGVMLSHQDGTWTGPAFYDVGGVTAGLEAGISGGRVAFLLMSDQAVQNFKQKDSFSLSADAGFTILNYSANAGTSWGKGDVVTWSDTQGVFAGAGVGVSDVKWNAGRNAQYYGSNVMPNSVLAGNVRTERGGHLKDALAG